MPAGFLPDDLTSTIGDLINRVRKLETFKAVMQPLLIGPGLSVGPVGCTTTPTEVTGCRSASFVVTKPTPIMVIPTLVWQTPAAGAGVAFQYMWAYVSNLDGTEAADINNQAMICTVATGNIAPAAISCDTCHPFSAICPPGTYRLSIFNACNAGTGSTMMILGQLAVYSMG